MTEFNPELYLRLLGERDLAEGKDLSDPFRNAVSISEAADALAVMGVISWQLAWEVTSEYRRASLVSRESELLNHAQAMVPSPSQPEDAPDPGPVPDQRTYALDRSLELPSGKLWLATLSATASGGHFQGTYFSDTDLSGIGGGPPVLGIGFPSGTSTRANFGGGWGDRTADGRFTFEAELPDDLPWVEIAGHRIELPPPALREPVQTEQFDEEGRAMRYLWQLIGDFNGRHNHSRLADHAAMDALVRAGLIAADDPELEAVLWVADAFNGQGPRVPMRMRRRHGPPASVPGDVPAHVPAMWRSFLQSPVSGPGPELTIALSAATPVFDHISVGITALRCSEDATVLEVLTSSSVFRQRGHSTPTVWSAEDDLGNHYIGESGAWSGIDGQEFHSGQIEFGPLHRKARRLTVAITALNARALIPIDLEPPAPPEVSP